MRKLSIFFWIIVAGVIFSLGASIYSGVRQENVKSAPIQTAVPLPAT